MGEDGQKFDQTVVALSAGGKASRLLKGGDIIGDSYRLKKLLGQGGMGYVFRAEHIIIGKDYALKMLAPDQINEVTWNRFQSEGKAIARLDHPNIVKIYNMGIDQGQYPYYVMDLLEGVVLSDCIADKLPLSLDEILDMFIQLASGFGYAHSRGIIHRDVKPSNVVLIDSGGQYPTAKIVDFGIAKLVGSSDLHHQSLTATGEIFGSPYYMSPEQCLGTAIDHRTDIYSLGCTLFEALCGHPPFEGESALQTVMMHQSRPTPTLESASNKYWGEEMEALVAKMLMKRPAERYQSMDQVLHDLERIRGHKAVGKNVETGFITSVDSRLEDLGSGYEGEQQSKRKRRTVLIVCTIPVVVLALAVGGLMYHNFKKPSVKPPKPTIDSATVEKKDYLDYRPEKARRATALKQQVKKFKPITTSVDKASGLKTFHCPDLSVGLLKWGPLAKESPWVQPYTKVDGRVKAVGDVQVPADRPIWIYIDFGLSKEAFDCPELLGKFGPTDLAGLEIHSGASSELLGDAALQKEVASSTAALLKAASGWTDLRYCELYNLPATEEILMELDKHKTLRYFALHSEGAKGEVIAKRPFLHQLINIQLFDLADSGPVLGAFKGSTAIERILVENSSATASGLMGLAGCPNLKALHFNTVTLDSNALEAMSTIKSLQKLSIVHCDLKPNQIGSLAKLGSVPELLLDICDWPQAAREQLALALPKAKLSWQKEKPKPLDAY